MRFRISEQSEWGSADGRRIKIKDLEDNHLLNIIVHMKEVYGYDGDSIHFFVKLAKKRGLKIRSEKTPYKKSGKWQLWTTNGVKFFVGERFLDVDICKKCKLSEYEGSWTKEDEYAYRDKMSICFKECKKQTNRHEIPEGCTYFLEQLVKTKNTIEVEDAEEKSV